MDKLPQGFLKNPVNLLAFGLGSGCAPKAPGTFGTAMAVLFYIPLQYLPLWLYLGFIVVTFILGVWLCDQASKTLGVHDHGGIVWDEFVGYWITMIAAPAGWVWMLIGFLLFRLFDIWKPWPIGYFDKHVKGGLGIMMDDVVAGIMSWGMLYTVVHFVV